MKSDDSNSQKRRRHLFLLSCLECVKNKNVSCLKMLPFLMDPEIGAQNPNAQISTEQLLALSLSGSTELSSLRESLITMCPVYI